jgi:hypothetical protein
MACSASENIQSNGIIEEIIVTARRIDSTSMSASEKAHLADVRESLEQTAATIGKLESIRTSGGRYQFDGATTTLDWNLRTAVRAFRLDAYGPLDTESTKYHIYLPDSISGVWDVAATTLRFNLFDSILAESFSCGGFNYLRFQSDDAGSIARGEVLQLTGGVASNGLRQAVKATGRTTGGIFVCGTKGETSISDGEDGLALLTGSLPYDLAGTVGTAINYASGGSLTTGAGLGFRIGYVVKARTASSPVGSWGLLGINTKFGSSLS